MKTRRGSVLLHVLFLISTMLIAGTSLLQVAMAARVATEKSRQREQTLALVEGARSIVWECLTTANYGFGASCNPSTSAQRRCLRRTDYEGLEVRSSLSGTQPNCQLRVDVTIVAATGGGGDRPPPRGP